MAYDVAVIGTGDNSTEKDRDGYAMAYRHASGYERLPSCSFVACADLIEENARRFAEYFDVPEIYESYEKMLAQAQPDIVSVCVPTPVHAEIVINAAQAGSVSAIHCEKPMATTWADCREMVRACEDNDVQLTIDHQRRFAVPVRKAKHLLENDEIGTLQRLEWGEVNLFDAGTHLFDLCQYFTDSSNPEWVLAGIDLAEENRWFGALNETRAIAQWAYDDGTMGVASTAEDGQTVVDPYLRLVGSDGVIEIQTSDGVPLRVQTDGGWSKVDTNGESVYGPTQGKMRAAANKLVEFIPGVSQGFDAGPTHYERAIEHLVNCLDAGQEPVISGRKALQSTELIFGCWESVRQRGQVSLPLEIDDNPLEAMNRADALGNGSLSVSPPKPASGD